MTLSHRLARGLLLVALAVGVFWTLGELVARGFNLIDRLNGVPRRLYMATDEPDLGFRLRPNQTVEARGVHIVTNSFGLRGPEISQTPAPGTRRLLVLGDSVAFGYRMEEPDTFVEQLRGELERRAGGSWEVLNAGIEGYNTVNEVAYLRSSLLQLEPQTIVLLFNLNDYDDGPVMGPLGALTRNQAVRVRVSDSPAIQSEFYLLLRWLYALLSHEWVGQGDVPQATPAPGDTERFTVLDRLVSSVRKQFYWDAKDERWPRMIDALRELETLCRARGIRLLVAIIPDGDQIGVQAPIMVPQRRLAAVCRDLQLECLDLYPSFAAAGDTPLFMDIMHPNAAGHRLMAREVATALLDQKR